MQLTIYATQARQQTGTLNTIRFLHRISFVWVLMIILWVPIPLGSSTAWGWTGITLFVWCLTALTYLLDPSRSARQLWNAWSALLCWLLIIFWQLIQLIPLPPEWINATLGATLFDEISTDNAWRALSINSAQTELMLIQTLSFFGLFTLVLMLVNSAKRIIIIALVLGIAGVYQVLYGGFLLTSDAPFSPIFDLPITYRASGTYLLPEQYAYCVFIAICAMLGVLLVTLQPRKSHTTRARFRRWIMYIFSRKGAIRLTIPILFVGLLLSQNVVIILTCSTSLALLGLIAYNQLIRHSTRYRWFLSCLIIINAITLSIGVNWALTDTEFNRHFPSDFEVNTLVNIQDVATQKRTSENATEPDHNFSSLLSVFGTGAGTVTDSNHLNLNHWDGHLVGKQKSDWHIRIVEYGFIGAFFYLALVLLSLRAGIYALYLETRASSNSVGFICLAIIMGTLIVSCFTHAMQAPANSALFSVIMALAFCADTVTRNHPHNNH